MGTGKRILTNRRIEEYGLWLYQREDSPETIKKYVYYLRLFQKFQNGREVSKMSMLAWKEYLRRRYAPVTVNGAMAAANGLFKFLGWMDCRARLLKVKRQIFCPEKKELFHDEYIRLVEAACEMGNERLAMLLQTICSTGIRVSEVKYITVEAVAKEQVEVNCKGRVRIVCLTRKLCRMLKDYAEKHHIGSGMIFITRTGQAMDRSNIWREMKKLGEIAGVTAEKIFPHNLRHLFARSYYKQEKDLNRLADILGHSDINTTRIYTMESGSKRRKELEQLNLLIGRYNRISLLL